MDAEVWGPGFGVVLREPVAVDVQLYHLEEGALDDGDALERLGAALDARLAVL